MVDIWCSRMNPILHADRIPLLQPTNNVPTHALLTHDDTCNTDLCRGQEEELA
jgi:hypothetical protein